MKLCKDCKHYIEGWSAPFDQCAKRTLSSSIHLVRGGKPPIGFCEETRADVDDRCGPDAKWFAPREVKA